MVENADLREDVDDLLARMERCEAADNCIRGEALARLWAAQDYLMVLGQKVFSGKRRRTAVASDPTDLYETEAGLSAQRARPGLSSARGAPCNKR